ncbi:MAG: hypothetical protein WC076_02640 [Terrimicrobiaceae bacterium]
MIQLREGFIQIDNLSAFDLRHCLLEALRDLGFHQVAGVFQDLPALIQGQCINFMQDFSDTHN